MGQLNNILQDVCKKNDGVSWGWETIDNAWITFVWWSCFGNQSHIVLTKHQHMSHATIHSIMAVLTLSSHPYSTSNQNATFNVNTPSALAQELLFNTLIYTFIALYTTGPVIWLAHPCPCPFK